MFTSYFNTILHNQKLDETDNANIDKVFTHLQKILQSHPDHPIVRKAGSQAKNIAVHAKFDLDIQIIFPKEHPYSLQQIYENIFVYLSKYNELKVNKKNVAIETIWDNFKIDVVPAKFIDEEYVNVWQNQFGAKLRTSIDRQIELINSSGKRDIYKLIKLWKIAHDLKGPSFMYELLTSRALETLDPDFVETRSLSDIMFKVWEYIWRNARQIKLVDPTNVNNIVSELWDEEERKRIELCALYVIQGYEEEEITPIFWYKY